MKSAAAPGPFYAFALAAISFLGPLAVHLFMPVIPAVKIALNLSDAQAQLTFSIAILSMAFATLVYGSLSDRYGRRPVLLSGLALFLLGSALSALANSLALLVFGRFVQAVGAGCGVTLARAIARDVYGPGKLVKAIAYLTMAYTIGPMIAPLLGGILIDAFGWRSVFGAAFASGGLIVLIAYFVIAESRSPGGRLGGNFLRDYLYLFRHLRFTCFVLQSGFVTGAFLTTASAASSLMKEVLHRPSTEFGLYFLLFPFGFLSGSFIASRIGSRAANETMVLAGSLMLACAICGQIAVLLSGTLTPLLLCAPGFLITFSQGISLSYAQSGAMATEPRLAGTAAGMGVFVQNFCGAVFAQLYGLLADGTALPLLSTTAISACLALVVGIPPFVTARMRRSVAGV